MNGIRGWKKRRASWKNYFSYYSISQNLRKLIHNDHLIGIHPNNTRKQWKENQIKWSKAVMMPLILLMCVHVFVCVPSTTTAAQQGLKQICARGPMTDLLHLWLVFLLHLNTFPTSSYFLLERHLFLSLLGMFSTQTLNNRKLCISRSHCVQQMTTSPK